LLVHIGDPSSNQATTLESQMIHMIQELFGQTLTLDISGSKRFIDCRISRLRTKAKEVVTFPFILQYGSDPAWKSPINGMVRFQGIVRFDANRFPEGPDWARSPAGW
jgi:hypothetical protein